MEAVEVSGSWPTIETTSGGSAPSSMPYRPAVGAAGRRRLVGKVAAPACAERPVEVLEEPARDVVPLIGVVENCTAQRGERGEATRK